MSKELKEVRLRRGRFEMLGNRLSSSLSGQVRALLGNQRALPPRQTSRCLRFPSPPLPLPPLLLLGNQRRVGALPLAWLHLLLGNQHRSVSRLASLLGTCAMSLLGGASKLPHRGTSLPPPKLLGCLVLVGRALLLHDLRRNRANGRRASLTAQPPLLPELRCLVLFVGLMSLASPRNRWFRPRNRSVLGNQPFLSLLGNQRLPLL
jgi:hypothetical protein